MKLIWSFFISGMILLYFIDAALKVELLNLEMLAHSLIRFITGFLILGIWCLYAQKIKFKYSIYIILILLLADDIYDYYRAVDSLTPEIVLHSLYMLFWGACMGYIVMKYFRKEQQKENQLS